MKNIFKLGTVLLIWSALFLWAGIPLRAQDSKHGSQLTPRGEIRVLIVFAEIVNGGTCTPPAPHDWNASVVWPSGTAAPLNADNYLDYVWSATPSTFLSRYYRDISLDEYHVIGDYYDGTVQVPCSLINFVNNDVWTDARKAIQILNTTWVPVMGNYYTKHGININDFDDYQNLGQGIQKPPGNPDGKIDVTVVLWRNHPFVSCGSGAGVGAYMGEPLVGKTCGYFGSWGGCPSSWATGYDGFFVAEYFHAIMGGNNFHTGGGMDPGTFMFDGTGSWSTSAQSGSMTNIVCGWDRNFFDWRGVGANQRLYRISAQDLAGQEVPSDISIATHPSSQFFVLRDFVTVGDMVRIKLPHFDYQGSGDRKNQYLWIENHQVGKPGSSEFDKNRGYANCRDWQPGLYIQLQAGKDIISGTGIYGGSSSSPNSLNDWLFPLMAEGNWDYYYDYAAANINYANCAWGNKSLPYSKYFPVTCDTKPNPFTGYNDAFGSVDFSQNCVLLESTDDYQPRLQKWFTCPSGPPVAPNIPIYGDELDAFNMLNQKVSIATNPAPMPVYTSMQGFAGSVYPSWENRVIALNNIAITILDLDYYGTGSGAQNAILIRIDWDDPVVDEDVRWCGNIVLKNDPLDPGMNTMQIDLTPGKTITLDRGLSPTQFPCESGLNTQPTCLHMLDGTATTLENGSTLNVINGSTLHLEPNSILIIGPNATVNIDATSYICVEPGANIVFQDPLTSVININGVSYYSNLSLLGVVLQNTSTLNYHAYNSIVTGNLGPTPTTMVTTGTVELEAGVSITLGPNTYINPSSPTNNFWAHIDFPSNCSAVCSYALRPAPLAEDNDESKDEELYSENEWALNFANTSLTSAAAVPVTDMQSKNNISVYPNPTAGKFMVHNPDGKPVTIYVYDLNGSLVYYHGESNDADVVIDISAEKGNLFMVKVVGPNDISSFKVIRH